MRAFAFVVAATSFATSIQIRSISPFGSIPGTVEGRVTGADPAAVRIAAYIFVSGVGWFSKPTCASPTTALQSDGTFRVQFTSGGVDDLATRIGLFAVPAATPVGCTTNAAGISEVIERAAAASVIVRRPDPEEREVQFAGEKWVVKANRAPVGPGPNYFSNSADNVSVDTTGRLHLRITNRDGRWYSAEVVSRRRAGYGTYRFTLARSPRLDPRAVFGAFVWADGERDAREIDYLEIGMFGRPADGTNAQYAVQPFSQPGNLQRITLPDVPVTTHVARWEPERLVMESYRGATTDPAARIVSWTYAGRPPRPDSLDLNFRFNLWLFQTPPAEGREIEMIVESYRFEPLAETAVRPAATHMGNGASFLEEYAPGGILSVFGQSLSAQTASAGAAPLPESISGTAVTVNGLAAPLYYVSAGQINAQIPYATPLGIARVVVQSGATVGDPVWLPLKPEGPGIFLIAPGQCLAQNLDWTLNSPTNPAVAGGAATVYLTGIGAVTPGVETGTAAPLSPLSRPVANASARLDQESVPLQFLGLAPGMVGVAQANILIPAGAARAGRQLAIRVGSADSNPCQLFVSDGPE
jgi:uncharacterized protein (TIGR03437 family)